MWFAVAERCSISGCQKERISLVMIWQLLMLWTFTTFHFREQLLLAICSAKQAHYLLGVSDKVGESSRRKHVVHIGASRAACDLQATFWGSLFITCHTILPPPLKAFKLGLIFSFFVINGEVIHESWTHLIAFHIALIPLRKVWIQNFFVLQWYLEVPVV